MDNEGNFEDSNDSSTDHILTASLNLNLTNETTIASNLSTSSSNASVHSAPPDLSNVSSSSIPSPPKKKDEFKLPCTVTTLQVNETKVYLIGTAHFSTQSQDEVKLVVEWVKPTTIFLELCQYRRNILHMDEDYLLREASDLSFSKVMQTLKSADPNTSRVQTLLHLLLLSMSASLTRQLGMAPGGEFRTAIKSAQSPYTLCLGDRPFSITLQRAIHSLSLYQKIKLFFHFLTSSTDDITKEEIEKCKNQDLLEKMLIEMAGEFPSITEVFVTERDYFLAHTLHQAAMNAEDGSGVVAVVGMGHVPGMVKFFGKTEEGEFRRIASPPEKKVSIPGLILKSTLKLCLFGLVGYCGFKVVKFAIGRTSNITLFSGTTTTTSLKAVRM